MCVCSLNYSACKVNAPYYAVVCGLSGSTTFFNIISNSTIARKVVIEYTMFLLICDISLV